MNNNSRIVIFCESYPSIAYTLHKLTRENGNVTKTIFFPAMEDLYRLFQIINGKVFNNSLELVYYPQYERKQTQVRGIKKLLCIFVDILQERRHLKKFYNRNFARLKDAEILFPSPGYSGVKVSVLQRLSKKNRLVFIDPGPPYMGTYSLRSIRDISTLLLYKMVYGRNTQIGQFPSDRPWDRGFPLLSKSFMKKSVDGFVDWSNRDKIMENFEWEKFNVFETSDYKVIYFHQDWVDRYVPDRDTFSRELHRIFDIILRYFPEEKIARKYHPGHELNKDVIDIGQELPIFIPAEFLYNKNTLFYLGISSTAIANVRGEGQAISLINLISLKQGSIREQFKERLINSSHTKILFPSSLEELENIIGRVVVKT